MIGNKSIARFLGVWYAAVFGSVIMFGIHFLWPDVSAAVLLLVSGAGFVVFYFVGRWIAVRTELNKKLPTSGKELKRRTKAFYEWLDSQGPQSPGDNRR